MPSPWGSTVCSNRVDNQDKTAGHLSALLDTPRTVLSFIEPGFEGSRAGIPVGWRIDLKVNAGWTGNLILLAIHSGLFHLESAGSKARRQLVNLRIGRHVEGKVVQNALVLAVRSHGPSTAKRINSWSRNGSAAKNTPPSILRTRVRPTTFCQKSTSFSKISFGILNAT